MGLTPELQPRVVSGILPSGRALVRGWDQFIRGLGDSLKEVGGRGHDVGTTQIPQRLGECTALS